jgi:uncharacterized protein YggE
MRTRRLGGLGTAAIIGLVIMTAAGCSGSEAKTAKPVAVKKAAPVGSEGSYHGPTIVVAGTGDIKGTPDTVTLSLGVQTIGPSAVEALNSNNFSASTLIGTLKQRGVAAKDIQTSNLSVSPNYDKYGHITGYGVSNSVTVTLHGVKGAGAIIDAAANAVGNAITFNGISLSIGDDSSRSLIAQARAAAVKQAIDHARQLAAAAGVTLGAVRKIDDTGTEVPQPQYLATNSFARDQAAAVPIEAGSQQLSVNVAVTFAISS